MRKEESSFDDDDEERRYYLRMMGRFIKNNWKFDTHMVFLLGSMLHHVLMLFQFENHILTGFSQECLKNFKFA